MPHPSRRHFLATAALTAAALLGPFRAARATRHGLRAGPHPNPRPGITGAKVLTKEQLADSPELIPLFDDVREIPQILDGIRCNCGCANLPGMYSLLSCYEGDAMARMCHICQGEGRLAVRLQKAGKNLDDIRRAIDARFG